MFPVMVPYLPITLQQKYLFFYSYIQNSFSILYKAILNAYIKKDFYDLNFYIFFT